MKPTYLQTFEWLAMQPDIKNDKFKREFVDKQIKYYEDKEGLCSCCKERQVLEDNIVCERCL